MFPVFVETLNWRIRRSCYERILCGEVEQSDLDEKVSVAGVGKFCRELFVCILCEGWKDTVTRHL